MSRRLPTSQLWHCKFNIQPNLPLPWTCCSQAMRHGWELESLFLWRFNGSSLANNEFLLLPLSSVVVKVLLRKEAGSSWVRKQVEILWPCLKSGSHRQPLKQLSPKPVGHHRWSIFSIPTDLLTGGWTCRIWVEPEYWLPSVTAL